MRTIEIGPEDAQEAIDLSWIKIDGVLFQLGDKVSLKHNDTGSIAYGTLGYFYGVGRIRGAFVEGTPFGDRPFPFGLPGDDEIWTLAHVPPAEPTPDHYFPHEGDLQIIVSTTRSTRLTNDEVKEVFAALKPLLGPALILRHVAYDERPRLDSAKALYEDATAQARRVIARRGDRDE